MKEGVNACDPFLKVWGWCEVVRCEGAEDVWEMKDGERVRGELKLKECLERVSCRVHTSLSQNGRSLQNFFGRR